MNNQRTALITGASGALGGQLSRYLADKNYNVVLHYNSHPERIEELAKEIEKFEVEFLKVKADISKEAPVENMFSLVEKEFGKLDVLINMAGIHIDKPLWKLPLEDWKKVIDVNLTGTFLCSKYAIPLMRKENFGRIINIASVVGQRGEFGTSSYAASKSGLFGLTKTLAREVVKFNILTNTVALGYFSVGMTKDVPPEIQERLLNNTLMNRFGKPEELCSLIYYLASDNSAFITGQIIGINGGYYM